MHVRTVFRGAPGGRGFLPLSAADVRAALSMAALPGSTPVLCALEAPLTTADAPHAVVLTRGQGLTLDGLLAQLEGDRPVVGPEGPVFFVEIEPAVPHVRLQHDGLVFPDLADTRDLAAQEPLHVLS